MGVADRVVLDRAQAEALRGVVGRLLQPAIVEHQRFGLAVFQEQLAVVGARKPARDLVAHLVAVEVGAVEQGGRGGMVMETPMRILRPVLSSPICPRFAGSHSLQASRYFRR